MGDGYPYVQVYVITEYIPTFFSPNGILTQDKDYNLNITEIIGQCELFFNDL